MTALSRQGHATRLERPSAFFHAVCESCGWRGPGRRAESSARKDGELHALAAAGSTGQQIPDAQ